jgi:hypothetical protein
MNDNWHDEIFFENQSAHLMMIQAGIKSYHPFKWHKDLQVAKSTDLPIAEPTLVFRFQPAQLVEGCQGVIPYI